MAEIWMDDHTIKTPWGFTLEQAFESLKFKQMVEGDSSPLNKYSQKPDEPTLVNVFGDHYSCKVGACTNQYMLTKDRPKGQRYGVVGDYLCVEHYLKLVAYRKRKKELQEQRRKEWEAYYAKYKAIERRRDQQLRNLSWGLRNPNYADELERNAQKVELKELREERERELKGRSKKRYTGPPRKGYVYRMYDASKTLLYVGKTYNIKSRLFGREGHANTKKWFDDVLAVQVTEYKSESDALVAEGFAIRREKPRYNVAVPVQKQSRPPRKVSEYWELVSELC